MSMLETFDDPNSSVVDNEKIFTTAVVTHKFYSSFILELQPTFDKQFEENGMIIIQVDEKLIISKDGSLLRDEEMTYLSPKWRLS